MLISELSHLEVISEAPSILGRACYYHEFVASATSSRNGSSITFPSNRMFDVNFKTSHDPNVSVSISAPNVNVDGSGQPLSAAASASAQGRGNSFVFASVSVGPSHV